VVWVPLLRGLADQDEAPLLVGLHAAAVQIQHAQVVHTRRATLLRGQAVQVEGGLQVLGHAVAVLIHVPQDVLGHRMARGGGLAEKLHGLGEVAVVLRFGVQPVPLLEHAFRIGHSSFPIL
jgi:hypothetical protein